MATTTTINNDASRAAAAEAARRAAAQSAVAGKAAPKTPQLAASLNSDAFERSSRPSSAPQASSLLTEDSHDGSVNCLDRAADWNEKATPALRARSEMVFLKDGRGGAEGEAGHVVIRQGVGVLDPASGKSYESLQGYLKDKPYYSPMGTLSGTAAAKIFDTAPGSPERQKALADAKVPDSLQRAMVADGGAAAGASVGAHPSDAQIKDMAKQVLHTGDRMFWQDDYDQRLAAFAKESSGLDEDSRQRLTSELMARDPGATDSWLQGDRLNGLVRGGRITDQDRQAAMDGVAGAYQKGAISYGKVRGLLGPTVDFSPVPSAGTLALTGGHSPAMDGMRQQLLRDAFADAAKRTQQGKPLTGDSAWAMSLATSAGQASTAADQYARLDAATQRAVGQQLATSSSFFDNVATSEPGLKNPLPALESSLAAGTGLTPAQRQGALTNLAQGLRASGVPEQQPKASELEAQAARAPAQPSAPALTPGKLPNTAGLSEAQKFDLYAGILNKNGSAQARSDLAAGKRTVLALRVDTNTRANGGKGVYDDRMVMLWKDANGTKHAQEYRANTEPSAQYEGRFPVLGRLAPGTYRYSGITQYLKDDAMMSTSDQVVQRDRNHDGLFDARDGRQVEKGNMQMMIHQGGPDNTWSAGCQTLPNGVDDKFFKDLNNQQQLSYVLVDTNTLAAA